MGETTSKAIAGFAAWAATYDQTIAREVQSYMGMPYAEVLQRVMEGASLAPDARVLDVGTGTGALALAIARQLPAGHITGIDPTAAMLRQAQEHATNAGVAESIEFKMASGEALPFTDASFDAVVSSIALHHSQVKSSLREMVRVLKPGGHLSIADPARNPRWNSALGLLMSIGLGIFYLFTKRSITVVRAELDSMKQLFLKEEWEDMLRDLGLSSIEVREFPHPTSQWYSSMLFIRAVK